MYHWLWKTSNHIEFDPMESTYLHAIIRNTFGEVPGNSINPRVSNMYLPTGTIQENGPALTEVTFEDTSSARPLIQEPTNQIEQNSDPRQSDKETNEESKQLIKKQLSTEINNQKTNIYRKEATLKPQQEILVGKRNKESIPLAGNSSVGKKKIFSNADIQEKHKKTTEKNTKEISVSIPAKTLQPENKFSESVEKNVSNDNIQDKKPVVSDSTISMSKKKVVNEKSLKPDNLEKPIPIIVPVKQKNTSGSIELVPEKQDHFHIDLAQKPQTKLIIGKLTVEIMQPEKEKVPSDPVRERIIVESPPKKQLTTNDSGLKVKYGLGQL